MSLGFLLWMLLSTCSNIETIDQHSKIGSVVVDNTYPLDTIAQNIAVEAGVDIIVAPDKGAVERASKVAGKLGVQCVYLDKQRINGEVKVSLSDDVDLTGKSVCIVDDICDGGRTFIEAAKVLRNLGAEFVDLYVTHGIFSAGVDELAKHIDHIVTTDTYRDADSMKTILEHETMTNTVINLWSTL